MLPGNYTFTQVFNKIIGCTVVFDRFTELLYK